MSNKVVLSVAAAFAALLLSHGTRAQTSPPPAKSKVFFQKDTRLNTLLTLPDRPKTNGSDLFRLIRAGCGVRVSTVPSGVPYRDLEVTMGAEDMSGAALLDAFGAFYMGDWERTKDEAYLFLPPVILPKRDWIRI